MSRSSEAPPLVPTSTEAFLKASQAALQDMEARFGPPLGEGRHRAVFYDREAGEVIKVPIERSGIDANFYELDLQDIILARTELDPSSTEYGIPLLRMEYVEPIPCTDHKGLPGWTLSIDCQQVGYTKDGRLVAYDWDRQ